MAHNGPHPKWASNEDWIQIRPLLTQLYREMSLKDVKHILEKQHNFYATYAQATRPLDIPPSRQAR